MLEDYHYNIIRTVVSTVADGGGGTTETLTTSTIRGYIAQLNSFEKVSNAKLGIDSIARLFTEAILNMEDRVTDEDDTVYEIVGKQTKFHIFYELKTFANK